MTGALLTVAATIGAVTGPFSSELDSNPFAYVLSALVGAGALLQVLS